MHACRSTLEDPTHHHFRGKWWKRAEGFGYGLRDVDDLFRDFVRDWHETYMRRRGKRRWADKTPSTIRILPYLWELFPTAKFVHMIRDGRDVCCSILEQKWGPDDAEEAAARWVSCIQAGAVFREDRTRYREIRYEELAQQPEPVLRALCEWIGEPFEPAMLRFEESEHDLAHKTESSAHQVEKPLYTSALGRWRRDMPAKDLKRYMKIAGKTLESLGYPAA